LSVKARVRGAGRAPAALMVRSMPLAPFLRSRRRYDRALREGDPEAGPPLLLRLARLREIPAGVRSFTPPGRPDVRFVNIESLTTQWIYWLGMDWVDRHGSGARLWGALCERSKAIVEIGANLGFFTICGGKVAPGSYRAFEPHPRSAAAMRANLAENGVDRVEVIEAAIVPDGWGATINLYVPPGNGDSTPGSATLVAEHDASIEVPAVPIGAALAACDLLKLDVESFEPVLLAAAWPTLVRLQPTLMVEVHDVNVALRGLLPQLIASVDGRAFAMRRSTLTPVNADAFARGHLYETFGTWDFLIVPRHRAATVDALVEVAG
jgi:FkbM family methyltransferase